MDKRMNPATLREHLENTDVDHTMLMTSLSDRHAILFKLIGDRPFHYVDFPVHGNIGDLLIMHGTLAFFERYGLKPSVSAAAFAYDPQWIRKGDVVVFHGGGNFGDLYADYGMQGLREFVAGSRPENRVVVLPQTIHFSSEQERKRSAKVFRQHPDLHLCVRDYASFLIAREFTDHVYLLPDMAHQLYPIAPLNYAAAGTLRISRMDDEKMHNRDGIRVEAATTTDWPVVVGDRERRIETFRRAMRATYRVGLGWRGNRMLTRLWSSYSAKLIDDAVALFSAHERIVTDRLHGHILACLMDRPSIVLDNSYGKNSGYVGAWTGGSELVSLQQV